MAETITQENIGNAVVDYSCLFGANKNLYRTHPVLEDGLKPGRRRLYYTWWLREGKPTNTKRETLNRLKFIKAARISSETMSIHPHGDVSNAVLLIREGQSWNNNVMAIVPQGSFGNLRGDKAADGRYSEAKMSEYMVDCFFDDFDKYCVHMKPSYDGDIMEPEYLPAKYPHILFNPQLSGIGYALASNIPPFNVAEVLDATVSLIKNPNAHILLIPDSPTGADIIDEGNFSEINKTGQSKFTLRATSEIDYQENVIKFTTIPLQTSTMAIIDNIIKMKKNKGFDEITEIKDYTKNGVVDLRLKLKSDANPDKVLRQLYKKNTNLKMTYPVGITVIDDYQDYSYGVKGLLLAWIDFRRDIVRSMFMNNLQNVQEKIHMNKVLLMVFSKNNIDKTVKIAKESKSRKDTIEKLMKEYSITSLQAATIADMHVYNFNEDSYLRYKQDKVELEKSLKEIEEGLSHDSMIDEFIINQLKEGKKKYGRPRLSKVVKEDNSDNKSIPNTEHIIGISESGYIKKLDIKDNNSIGPVGKENGNLTVMQINNREDILVIDNTGMVSKISVSAIPDMKFNDIGIEIARYFTVKGKIIGIMKLPDMKVLKSKDDNLCIIFITKKGLAKKVPISEFKKITDCKSGITLNYDDELAVALFAFDNTSKEIIICTNIGNGVRLSINDIKVYGRAAKGTPQIKLKDGEEIVNACKIDPDKKLLFYVTSSGKVKLTELKYFPAMQRKDESLSLISLSSNETLVGVSSVSKSGNVICYRKNSEPVELQLKDLKVAARISKGEKIIKTPKGDSVVAYKVFQ